MKSPVPGLTTSSAFDLLAGEIDARLGKFHVAINEASVKHAYEQVAQLAKAAQEVADLKKELASLEKKGGALVEAEPDTTPAAGTKYKKGLKTPESAYQRPILEARVELGGSSELHAVLDRVFQKMTDQLNPHDLSPLPSDGITPRWRNTAQWARNALREGGYIRDDCRTACGRSATRVGSG